MGAWDGLIVLGVKAVADLIFNNDSDKSLKEKAKNMLNKDYLDKSVSELNDIKDNIILRAEKVQKEEMTGKSVKELKEIIKKDNSTTRTMAANLELKARGLKNY